MACLFMDLIDLGCTAFRAPLTDPIMTFVGFFGHGSAGAIIALSLLTHGYLYQNTRTKSAGFAVIIALILAGSSAALLKEIVHWPRPSLRTSSGFPSGHTSAAFALAGVLGVAFPGATPFFYLLAVLTGLSRLYFRAHFTWDVLGGAVIGIAVGLSIGQQIIRPLRLACRSPVKTIGWSLVSALGIGTLIFFHVLEREIEASLSVARLANGPVARSLDFGTPEARKSLRAGWYNDELWDNGKLSLVWAGNKPADLALTLPNTRSYQFGLTLFPYSPNGLVCQRVGIKLNGESVASLFLEKGWHTYQFAVPRQRIRPGENLLQFFFAYTSPIRRGETPDNRRLSVAFDRLSVY